MMLLQHDNGDRYRFEKVLSWYTERGMCISVNVCLFSRMLLDMLLTGFDLFARLLLSLFVCLVVCLGHHPFWLLAVKIGTRLALLESTAAFAVPANSVMLQLPRLKNADCVPNHPYMVSAATCSPQESADQGTGADWRAAAMPFC